MKDTHTAEDIRSLAEGKSWEHFQYDEYWNPIYIYGKWREYMEIQVKGIDLSLDGKIMMECTNGIFDYFASVLRKKYNNYSLSKALYVTIAG